MLRFLILFGLRTNWVFDFAFWKSLLWNDCPPPQSNARKIALGYDPHQGSEIVLWEQQEWPQNHSFLQPIKISEVVRKSYGM